MASKTALVVDDGPVDRIVNIRVAKDCGFQTSSVKNGQEAVNLHDRGESFDLIIMDMQMPMMNGIQATRELRNRGVKCQIIGATGSEDDSKKTMFKEAGLDGLIEKPVSMEKLAQYLNP